MKGLLQIVLADTIKRNFLIDVNLRSMAEELDIFSTDLFLQTGVTLMHFENVGTVLRLFTTILKHQNNQSSCFFCFPLTAELFYI